MALDKCKRCGSQIKDGFCSDITCPYHDWEQKVEESCLYEMTQEQIEQLFGTQKRNNCFDAWSSSSSEKDPPALRQVAADQPSDYVLDGRSCWIAGKKLTLFIAQEKDGTMYVEVFENSDQDDPIRELVVRPSNYDEDEEDENHS